MKIIIIILICLFFSLSIPNINEFLSSTAGPLSAPTTPTAGQSPQNADPTQSTNNGTSLKPAVSTPATAQPESGLQTQVNLLSSSVATTNTVALEAKKKVDDISSQIEKLKEQLKKPPTD